MNLSSPRLALSHIKRFANWARLLRYIIAIGRNACIWPNRDAPSLLDAVQILELSETAITITNEHNAQEADAACVVAEIPGDIGTLEIETVRNRETIATHAERDRRVVAVREAGLAWPEESRIRLEGTPCELAVVNSPTQILPDELMTEIFDWHMLMGGRLTTTLLVCKRWTMVAYCSPRLWARISVTNHAFRPRRLRGSILCAHLDNLRLVLSRSWSCPLELELSFSSNASPHHI